MINISKCNQPVATMQLRINAKLGEGLGCYQHREPYLVVCSSFTWLLVIKEAIKADGQASLGRDRRFLLISQGKKKKKRQKGKQSVSAMSIPSSSHSSSNQDCSRALRAVSANGWKGTGLLSPEAGCGSVCAAQLESHAEAQPMFERRFP